MKEKIRIHSQSFVPKYNQSVSSYSAAILFSIGFFISLYSFFFTSKKVFINNLLLIYIDFGFTAFSSVYSILVQMLTSLLSADFAGMIYGFTFGWIVSGFIAGFVFGKKARGGSIEMVKIIFSMVTAFTLIILTFGEVSYTTLYSEDTIIFPGVLGTMVFLALMAIPLAILSLIGIQIGVMIKNV